MLQNFVAIANDQSIEVTIEIHPAIDQTACSNLPTAQMLQEEADFPDVLRKGWAKLTGYSFRSSRFYPCMQKISITFPGAIDYYNYIREMTSCSQYSFYSGADYEMQTAIFRRTAKIGDSKAYKLLLQKDGSGCASELNAPLFAILRDNLKEFLATFRELTHKMKKIAVANQYDFNIDFKIQQFNSDVIATLDIELKATAREFNALIESLKIR
jgi:hypothetical protein